MVLAGSDNKLTPTTHPYLYAKVLGTYHVNIVYVGPGTVVDYTPTQMEFLWVRWYQIMEGGHGGWAARKLDRVKFMPIGSPDAFGFVDPTNILRSCHMVPVFARGKFHEDGKGLSSSTGDSNDWAEYYVNR